LQRLKTTEVSTRSSQLVHYSISDVIVSLTEHNCSSIASYRHCSPSLTSHPSRQSTLVTPHAVTDMLPKNACRPVTSLPAPFSLHRLILAANKQTSARTSPLGLSLRAPCRLSCCPIDGSSALCSCNHHLALIDTTVPCILQTPQWPALHHFFDDHCMIPSTSTRTAHCHMMTIQVSTPSFGPTRPTLSLQESASLSRSTLSIMDLDVPSQCSTCPLVQLTL
jgi:hypothetical protein